ncbi:heme-binding protein [uncultured Nocardioides sp.]|uniref:SOUL family heme-binding protein n=1 Tax=uncultured Nocardioides sp. TaxID=198441 RepID=UPI002637E149|nr:heme-binding protein [uncultured Nocardioides sp.]
MTEQQPYEVVREHPGFELRRYPEHVVAETRVTATFEGAGNTSFRRLVGYIGGRNTQSRKVAMTAPVVQEAEGETAGRFVVGFVMPADFDLAGAPDPTDPDVRLRAVPAHTAAALRFSGRWTRDRYDEHARRLLVALDAAGLEVVGRPRFARFDPPWTPWFLRRNEVVVPVADPHD